MIKQKHKRLVFISQIVRMKLFIQQDRNERYPIKTPTGLLLGFKTFGVFDRITFNEIIFLEKRVINNYEIDQARKELN